MCGIFGSNDFERYQTLYQLNKDRGNFIVNIKDIKFIQTDGKLIKKSTLYKCLKSLCDKNLISHYGTKRSSTYKLN